MSDAPTLDLIDDPTTSTSVVGPLARATIAATAAGSAVVHFAMFPDHYQESTVLGIGFAVAAWFQLALAVAIVARPSRRVLQVGLVGSLLILGSWAVSRLIGLPLSGTAGEIEDVGTVDLYCAIFEGITAFVCAAALVRRPAEEPARRSAPVAAMLLPVVAVVLLTTTALASPESANHVHAEGAEAGASGTDDHADHTADEEHATDEHADMTEEEHAAHTEGATEIAASDDEHADHASAEPVPYDPALPLDLSGTPGVTPEQQAEAENIIAVTLAGLPQWTDPAVAEAAGFQSIGDGPATGIEHFVNRQNMQDEITFDPDAPESLVYDVSTGERRLVAAMYMLKEGTPLDDVPNTGGELIQWHIHDNLCYTPQGTIGGLTDGNGNCREGLIKPPETPMVHVWIEPHPCGPFAALEGIGGGKIAEGEERLCDTAHGSH